MESPSVTNIAASNSTVEAHAGPLLSAEREVQAEPESEPLARRRPVSKTLHQLAGDGYEDDVVTMAAKLLAD